MSSAPTPPDDLTQLTVGEREALVDELVQSPGAVDGHIRAGGTLASFVQQWKARRDESAAAEAISDDLVDQVLALPVPRWDPGETVRSYLVALLGALWEGNADLKYGMTGGSDWRYDLYGPMHRAGIIRGWRDGYGVGYREDGTHHPEDCDRADLIVRSAIRGLARPEYRTVCDG